MTWSASRNLLHHLRDEDDWKTVFQKLYDLTASGGSVWITDLVSHETPAVDELMWGSYGDYLEALGGPAYRRKVFDYIDKEDSPRPVTFQLELLRHAGFAGGRATPQELLLRRLRRGKGVVSGHAFAGRRRLSRHPALSQTLANLQHGEHNREAVAAD